MALSEREQVALDQIEADLAARYPGLDAILRFERLPRPEPRLSFRKVRRSERSSHRPGRSTGGVMAWAIGVAFLLWVCFWGPEATSGCSNPRGVAAAIAASSDDPQLTAGFEQEARQDGCPVTRPGIPLAPASVGGPS